MTIRLPITFLSIVFLVTSCTKSNEELLNEAFGYKAQGKFQKSIEVYSKVISRNRKLQAAYYNRGLCFIALKDYRKAYLDFDRVVNMHIMGGIIFELNKDAVFGTEEMKASISHNDALYQRGEVKYMMDSLKSAEKDFLYMYNVNYKKCPCLLWLGLISYSLGDSVKACRYFNIARQWAADEEELQESNMKIKKYCN